MSSVIEAARAKHRILRDIISSVNDERAKLVREELERRMGLAPNGLFRIRSVISEYIDETLKELIKEQERAEDLRAKEAHSAERPAIRTVRDPNTPLPVTQHPLSPSHTARKSGTRERLFH